MFEITMARNSLFKGVFFDYGGVLEDLVPEDPSTRKDAAVLHDLLCGRGIRSTLERLAEMLDRGQEEYAAWYRRNDFRELSGEQMWTGFFLKDLCRDSRIKTRIQEMSEELSSIYEFHLYRRRPVREAHQVIRTLFYAGYTLVLISNTMSGTLIPERLSKFGIRNYFSDLFLSVSVGVRKPGRDIFQKALDSQSLPAEQCIYVGDTLSRDVEGARGAGFGVSVLMPSGLTALKDSTYRGTAAPDHTITSLGEIYGLL
jgi:putative hydrolase of the HAD superfamily